MLQVLTDLVLAFYCLGETFWSQMGRFEYVLELSFADYILCLFKNESFPEILQQPVLKCDRVPEVQSFKLVYSLKYHKW